jgi:hypothetical protein
MVAHQATAQIMDVHYTLRLKGILIDGPSWLFGDTQSVIVSSTILQLILNKCRNTLSYDRVCECIAAEIINILHVDAKSNPPDIHTKLLGWSQFWALIQPFLNNEECYRDLTNRKYHSRSSEEQLL